MRVLRRPAFRAPVRERCEAVGGRAKRLDARRARDEELLLRRARSGGLEDGGI